MFSLAAATRIFVAVGPVDLRQSFNGLYGCVKEQLKEDPLSGHLFVFTNRQRNRLKVLFWDGSGLWVCAKRLEKGRLRLPQAEEAAARLRAEELTALVSGLEVRAKTNWYRR